MIKQTFSAIAAIAMAVTPAVARVDAGTVALINTIDDSDINLVIDPPWCQENPAVYGMYRSRGLQRQLVLCPGDTVDAEDHDTVRHEVAHAIQHCINAARGTHRNTPIVDDIPKLINHARATLGQERLDFIQRSYPKSHWLVEIEANIMASVFTSKEIEDMFKEYCLYNE
jgi:hypothetical protein